MRDIYVTGTISGLYRLPNSANGNPRWRVSIATADAVGLREHVTRADSDVNYGIENSEWRDAMVRFTINGLGQITNMEPA